MVLIRQSVRVSGISGLAITKLDVLAGLGKLKICTGYKAGDLVFTESMPSNLRILGRCEPVYEELDGWTENIAGAQKESDLPVNARKYLEKIEALSGVPIYLVSVGAGRHETIILKNPF